MAISTDNRSRRNFLAAAFGLATMAGVPINALAQPAYPSKAIRLIVPFPPGGQTDVVGRLIVEQLTRRLGQQMFVDNRSGASGNIGTHQVAIAEPDGHTLLLVPDSNMLISPLIYENLPYNPLKDFVPVGKVGDSALILVTNTAGRIRTVADVVSAAKAQSGGLSYGTAGVGTNAHIFAELFKQRTGTNLVHVVYKGGAPALTDVMGGQIPLVVTAVGSAITQIKAGKLVGIAVSTPTRSKSLPDVPTFIEGGVPDLFYNSWVGMFAPAKTPKPIMVRLNSELNAVMSTPEIRDKVADIGIVATVSAPDTFANEIKRDLERYAPIIKKAGIRAD